MRGSSESCQKVSNFDNVFFFFLVDEGRYDPNTTLSGPSSASQLNANYLAFCWSADYGSTLNVGLVHVAL